MDLVIIISILPVLQWTPKESWRRHRLQSSAWRFFHWRLCRSCFHQRESDRHFHWCCWYNDQRTAWCRTPEMCWFHQSRKGIFCGWSRCGTCKGVWHITDSYKVGYSVDALDDLREIHLYIANEFLVPETASAQLSRIRKEVRSLDFMPARYALVDWEPWHSMKMHQLPVDNFIVYYLVFLYE